MPKRKVRMFVDSFYLFIMCLSIPKNTKYNKRLSYNKQKQCEVQRRVALSSMTDPSMPFHPLWLRTYRVMRSLTSVKKKLNFDALLFTHLQSV